jgi:hypothetical protein
MISVADVITFAIAEFDAALADIWRRWPMIKENVIERIHNIKLPYHQELGTRQTVRG